MMFVFNPLHPSRTTLIVTLQTEATNNPDAKVKRRRLFGRSTESSSLKEKASSLKDSSSRHSRDLQTPPVSASPRDAKPEFSEDVPPMRRHSKKKSTDERKASDRLSLFGSPFSGTLGKTRKPPPRLSTYVICCFFQIESTDRAL